LAHAESMLRAFTSDQVDAIIDPDGKTYLLRTAQENLLQKERRLDAVIESTADIITVVNRQGAILSQSRPVSRVLGYEQGELVGTSIFKLIRDEDLPAVHSAFFNVIEGIQEHATAQFNHRSRDGSYRMVEATIGKLSDGDSPSVVFSLRPINHSSTGGVKFGRREAERTPVAHPKDRFLAMLAHELRTPLMPVLLCVGDLMEDKRFAEAEPILTMMRRNIELQSRLIDELADFTTIGYHKVTLRPQLIDVHETIRFVLEICRNEIAAAEVDIHIDLKASEHIVLADSLRLQQLMWSVVRNAIKFSQPDSRFSIASANQAPGNVTLECVDHGVGMFIGKRLAEAGDETRGLSSDGSGLGSTFRLTLKLAETAGMKQPDMPVCGLETTPGQRQID
jgi:PAS domain S-box-containing protein